MCPKGDDPVSSFTGHRSITITTGVFSGSLGGYFKFRFQDQTVTFPGNGADFSSTLCETTLEQLPNVGSVQCTQGVVNLKGETTYVILFEQWPTVPYGNNIRNNDGNPPLNDFYCDPTSATGAGPTCDISDNAVAVPPGMSCQ